MLMFTLSSVLLVLCLDYTHSYYAASGRENSAPMCTSRSKPCRLRVMLGDFNASVQQSSEADVCSCNHPHTCPTDWDTPGHVVSRKVISTTYNITLQMMFCRYVVPKRFCRRRERDIALVVKGPMLMPQDIEAYNCRCRRRQPLLLHQRIIGNDHLTYHKYVCANHKEYCSPSSPCLTMTSASTSYHCKCPEGTHCRTPWDGLSYGTCQP